MTVVTVFLTAGRYQNNRHNCHIPSRTITERIDKMGNVQISQELFMQLLRFHLVEDESCERKIKLNYGTECIAALHHNKRKINYQHSSDICKTEVIRRTNHQDCL
jgi:phosphorylcholine metabolism protein LicD